MWCDDLKSTIQQQNPQKSLRAGRPNDKASEQGDQVIKASEQGDQMIKPQSRATKW